MNQLSQNKLVRYGLLTGLALLYTATIGMIEVFSARAIVHDVLTLGQILLFAPPLIAGYFLTVRTEEGSSPATLAMNGAIVGAIATVPLLLAMLLEGATNVREMFVNISPDLVALLAFGQESRILGMGMLLVAMAVMGGIGSLIPLVNEQIRRPLLTAVITTLGVGLLSELFVQILNQLVGRSVVNGIFQRGALRPLSALILVVLVAAFSFYWPKRQAEFQARLEAAPPDAQRNWRYVQIGAGLVFLFSLPLFVGSFLSEVLGNVGLFILMGLGLNIAIGLAGLLDLGYVTNFAVGAYVMGVLTSTGALGRAELSFWMVIPICVLAAMFTGFIFALPVLRMRGDYLAIATLGFGEIIRILALSDWFSPIIGGAQGILFIPKPTIFGVVLKDPEQIYYLVVAACFLMLLISTRLNNSRTGRQWMAIREDEDVASSMGIDTIKAKLLAFTLSAASGGLAGAIFASKLSTIFPHSFNLLISVNVLSLIIVGGMGSIPGIVVGAFALIGLPELLREFAEYRLLLYGALLIVMMLARPEGLWPSEVRQRELQADDGPIDAALAAGD